MASGGVDVQLSIHMQDRLEAVRFLQVGYDEPEYVWADDRSPVDTVIAVTIGLLRRENHYGKVRFASIAAFFFVSFRFVSFRCVSFR